MGYKKCWLAVVVVLVMLFSLVVAMGATESSGPSYTEVWDGRGTDSEKCGLAGQEGRPETGWIHWVFSTKGASTSAELLLGGTGSGNYAGAEATEEGGQAKVWHFYTPYFELDGLTATINLYGGARGPGGGLVISDYCPGQFERLAVSKTAVTSYTREHFWDIDKKVETENKEFINGTPKVWLYVDGSGDETATWTVDVTYEDYLDKDFNVSGTITIENTGTLDAVITAVDDVLGGSSIDIDCSVEFPYTLPAGQTLTCTYSEDVESKIEGSNEVFVNTERDTYSADAPIIWGDPTTEVNKTVNIKDVSELFGEVELGTVTAPNGDRFTYDKDFAWADYGADNCGSFTYNNTATILETEQSASATLKVNVQCLFFKGETAWAANGDEPGELRYTRRGNWATYVEYSEKTTILFAGQTKQVGTVSFSAVDDGKITITVKLDAGWSFRDVKENLKVQDYTRAPSGNPAPGRFKWKENVDKDARSGTIVVPANKFYGVHVEVGRWVPDPNFGP